MILKATIDYSDGSSATFTGEPVDLSTLPIVSPEQQASEHPVEAPTAEVVEETPVEATEEVVAEEAAVSAPVAE